MHQGQHLRTNTLFPLNTQASLQNQQASQQKPITLARVTKSYVNLHLHASHTPLVHLIIPRSPTSLGPEYNTPTLFSHCCSFRCVPVATTADMLRAIPTMRSLMRLPLLSLLGSYSMKDNTSGSTAQINHCNNDRSTIMCDAPLSG